MLSHAAGRLSRVTSATAFRRIYTASVCQGFGSHVSDNNPEMLEEEKQKSLKDGPVLTRTVKEVDEDQTVIAGDTKSPFKDVPGWNEKLASDSEASVKAERHVHEHTTVEELQKHTVDHLQDSH